MKYYLMPLFIVMFFYWAFEIRLNTGIPSWLFVIALLFAILWLHDKKGEDFYHLPVKFLSNNDGDTFECIMSGTRVSIRIKSVDAPEYRNDDECQPYGKEAKDYLYTLLSRGSITVIDRGDRPSFNRLVRSVYVNGIDVQLEMIKAGLAWVDTRYDVEFKYLVAFGWARLLRKGLFKDKRPLHPSIYRKSKKAKEENLLGSAVAKSIMTAEVKK